MSTRRSTATRTAWPKVPARVVLRRRFDPPAAESAPGKQHAWSTPRPVASQQSSSRSTRTAEDVDVDGVMRAGSRARDIAAFRALLGRPHCGP